MTQKYRVNDRVRLIRDYGGIPEGTVGTVTDESTGFWGDGESVEVHFDNGEEGRPYLSSLESAAYDWQDATAEDVAVLKRLGVKFEERTLRQIKLIG